MNTDRDRISYWLLCDDRLALGRLVENSHLFVAHLKHSLLFHPQLAISDSYAVNNYNFRRSLKADSEVRQLVRDQMIWIASRVTHDRRMTLHEFRDSMKPESVPPEFGALEYRRNEELDLLEASAPKSAYSLQEVANRYGSTVSGVFASPIAEGAIANLRLFEEINKIIGELATESPERIKLSYFYYDREENLAGAVRSRVPEVDWQDYESKIRELAQVPYITSLPSVLGIPPIYAKDHAQAFNIIAGRSNNSDRLIRFPFSSRFGLQSFAKGLALLSRDSIHRLLDSDEGREVHRLLQQDDKQGLTDPRAVCAALFAYQERIEDEIVRSHWGLCGESMDGSEKQFLASLEQCTNTGGTAHTFISLMFSSLGFSLLGLLFTQPVLKLVKNSSGVSKRERDLLERAHDTRRMVHASKEDLLHAWRDSPRIDAEALFDSASHEVLYRGVR